jgi:hypothetical protein
MPAKTVKKPIYKKWWFWVIALIVIAAIGKPSKNFDNTTSSNVNSTQAIASEKMPPEIEILFLSIVTNAQSKANSASNDMQKSAIKSERDKSLCALLSNFQMSDWIGKVAEIDANSDGKGIISIEIAEDVYVKTWNNALSDFSYGTLIDQGSNLFNSASNLKRGAMVKFSGHFFRGSGGDCVEESSLTLNGKIKEPEFIFSFSDISPL